MSKYKYSEEDHYPIFHLFDLPHSGKIEIDISDTLMQRYTDSWNEFWEVQDILHDIIATAEEKYEKCTGRVV